MIPFQSKVEPILQQQRKARTMMWIALWFGCCVAYLSPQQQHHQQQHQLFRRRSTQPVLESSKMPDVPESLQEPGLKVPSTAWKWPQRWPYASDGFARVDEESTGAPEQILDGTATETLKSHLLRNLPSGCGSLLEIDGTGTGVSYVPENGGSEELWLPPEKVTRVSTEEWLEVTDALPYETDSFDAVFMAHAAELALQPRLLFREVWRVLKPGGRAIVAFSSPKRSTALHGAQTIKMWKDYNDAQRIYIVGSYFHFSAGAPAAAMKQGDGGVREDVWGAGWRGLKGFDYIDAAASGDSFLDKMKSGGGDKDVPLFVVQADKAPAVSPDDGALSAMDAALWAVPNAEEDDKRLFATRVLSLVRGVEDQENKKEIALRCARSLPIIYETLSPMSTVIATPLIAQLAANVAPLWNENGAAQTAALREGLGLDAPRSEFWKPLGELTADLTVDDKLWLLRDLLPIFDEATYPTVAVSDDYKLPMPLYNFVEVLTATLEKAKTDLGAAADARDAQLVAVDLVCRDFLPDAAAGNDLAAANYKEWLNTISKSDIESFLEERKNYRKIAEEQADLADLDPELAAQKAADKRRADAVEAMLNEIAAQLDAKKNTDKKVDA